MPSRIGVPSPDSIALRSLVFRPFVSWHQWPPIRGRSTITFAMSDRIRTSSGRREQLRNRHGGSGQVHHEAQFLRHRREGHYAFAVNDMSSSELAHSTSLLHVASFASSCVCRTRASIPLGSFLNFSFSWPRSCSCPGAHPVRPAPRPSSCPFESPPLEEYRLQARRLPDEPIPVPHQVVHRLRCVPR